jgi:phytoene desaturase
LAKKAIVIGSGFAGMSAATHLAQKGWQVTVLEKHEQPGGRARQMKAEGFTFDMGPSWYWMPDVFERYFNCFGKKVSDYYALKRLDPSYRVYWEDEHWDLPAKYEAFRQMLEKIEPGAAKALDATMQEAAYKYEVGVNKLVYKPSQSLLEFVDWELVKGIFKLDVFNNIRQHFGKHFQNPKIRQLMEFPVLFLGALPQNIPALYSLMNYADIKLGTWYPEGGMYSIVKAMHQLAVEKGVSFCFNEAVQNIEVNQGVADAVITQSNKVYRADVVIGGADYHHVEQQLLPAASRTYDEAYWDKRVMAPGSLLYYVGLNKKLNNVLHHSLFFDTSFDVHGKEIYEQPQWPSNPLFYVSAVTQTDPESAPAGGENLFFLIPTAAGINGDTAELRDRYFDRIVERFEKRIGEKIREHIVYYKTFAHADFVSDYNAFKGNAYGLANTLRQTAILKPSLASKKVKNLFYTGQLTVPGPGVPPSLISGEVVANYVNKLFS